MSLSTLTMATASVKKILGIAHTDDIKGPGNEALRTGFSVSGSTVFGGDVPPIPNKVNLYDETNGVVEYVRLKMTLDPTSNGHAYIASLPSDYQTASLNTKRGSGMFLNSMNLSDTAGKVQIIPSAFGARYEVNPYSGGSSTKGSGVLIPPMDARDWIIDPFNGIIYQQGSGGTDISIDYLECYIWIGDFVTDKLGTVAGGSFADSSALVAALSTWYAIDTYAPTDPNLGIAKWYISAHNADTDAFVAEVSAVKCGANVASNCYGKLMIGQKLLELDCDLDVSGNIRLKAMPYIAGLTVDIKRLAVN